ncbi:MAG TPA: glycoside hydrolase family 9 protein [Lachnospiraceae bacterium]|nr:glycoside hydrolase family 9 protein [Lachnospiraceae bacterium]
MKVLKIVCVIFCICLLGGCNNSSNIFSQGSYQSDSMEGMEGSSPDLSYEIIPQVPNVLVNQVGFPCSGIKVAIFRGDHLSDSFVLIDSFTKRIVYTGTIGSKIYNEELKEYISYGSFSEFEVEGNYYIQTDMIGQSYPFSIGKNLYQDIFTTTCKGFKDSFTTRKGQTYEKNSIMEDSKVIANLLLAFELYPDLFGDDLDISESDNGIPDILDEIKYKIDWFQTIQTHQMSGNDLVSYAGILAKFSQIYKLYDNSYSKQCLKSAESAYQLAETVELKNDSLRYFASVELYKATTYNKYHIVAKGYINRENSLDNESIFKLFGDFGYLSGKNGVDTALCGKIMGYLMDRAEKIASKSSKNGYFVCSYEEEEILEEMQYLAIIDYVITNHEYVTVQENHLHFLLGRNPQGVSFLEEGDFPITQQVNLSAQLIFMMSEILESEIKE